MAISLRRAIIINLRPVLRIVGRSSHLTTSKYLPCHGLPTSTAAGYLSESCRYFSSTSDNDDHRTPQFVLANRMEIIKSDAISEMDAVIDELSFELHKLSTGRASKGMLENFMVEEGGVKVPLYCLAHVSVLDSKTMSITPSPLNCNYKFLEDLRKEIVSSPLCLNPKLDATNKRLIISIPPLTEEKMQAACEVVTKSSEIAKERITRAWQKALESMNQAVSKLSVANSKKIVPVISENDIKQMDSEWTKIEELTQKYTKLAEDICEHKKNEITSNQGHSLLTPAGFVGSLP